MKKKSANKIYKLLSAVRDELYTLPINDQYATVAFIEKFFESEKQYAKNEIYNLFVNS